MGMSKPTHLSSNVRRAALTSAPNPDPTHDYLVDLTGRVGRVEAPEVLLKIRYVPSRLTLSPIGMEQYVTALHDESWTSLEALAITVLDDINTELAPRWVRVTAVRQFGISNLERHQVVIEDAEPTWHNRDLLDRVTAA